MSVPPSVLRVDYTPQRRGPEVPRAVGVGGLRVDLRLLCDKVGIVRRGAELMGHPVCVKISCDGLPSYA